MKETNRIADEIGKDVDEVDEEKEVKLIRRK